MFKLLTSCFILYLLLETSAFTQTATHIQIDFITPANAITANTPIYFIISARNIHNEIDTSYNNFSAIASVVSGSFGGTPTVSFDKGKAEFKEIQFADMGTYTIIFSSDSLEPDSITFKVEDYLSFGDSSSRLHFYKTYAEDTVLVGQSYFKYVFATDNAYVVDTTNTALVAISAINDTNGYFIGGAPQNLKNGCYIFSDLLFHRTGYYTLVCTAANLIADTLTILAISAYPTTSKSCDTATIGSRKNLGIYGGECVDLTYSLTTNRLFAGVNSPASLFYSDDSAKTWHAAFSPDSLEYNCSLQGWGGGGLNVLTNTKGWVSVYTEQKAGILKSSVISFQNGDSGTWKTAVDQDLITSLGYPVQTPLNIGLTDYFMYTVSTQSIVMQDESGIKNIISILSLLSGLPPQSQIVSIAAANTPSGFPFYIVVDTTGYNHQAKGILYHYDGTNFSPLTIPPPFNGLSAVFIPLSCTTSDTVFITGEDKLNLYCSYRSFDGGNTWKDISFLNQCISAVDYSPFWATKIKLFTSGKAYSDNFGDTWNLISTNQFTSAAILPLNEQYIVGSKYKGVEISETGPTGSFSIANNYGLEAVEINKLSRSKNKSIFYIATKAGLAYTTAYLVDSISPFDKWRAPYGEFPVSGINDIGGVYSVAIDPTDSLHIIIGTTDKIYTTTSGHTGFLDVTPTGFNGPFVKEIAFITSNIIIATTGRNGSEDDMLASNGDVWRSSDGGLSWTNVTPSGFLSGNSIAVGTSITDTVIYLGSGYWQIYPGLLWKSTDLGLNWIIANAGPQSQFTTQVDSLPIIDIAVSPNSTDTLYIAAGYNREQAFVVSYDGGQSYHYTNLIGEGDFSAVAINLNNPDSSVYVANRRNIYVYNPATDISELLFTGLPGELTPDLVHGSILAGTTTGFYGVDGDEANDNGVIDHIKMPLINTADDIRLYPNPATNSIHISLPNVMHGDEITITILDVLGNTIKSTVQKLANNECNMVFYCHDIASGTYFIRVTSKHKISNAKILISK